MSDIAKIVISSEAAAPATIKVSDVNFPASGVPLVSLTQAAYDALNPPDPNTLYDITDA